MAGCCAIARKSRDERTSQQTSHFPRAAEPLWFIGGNDPPSSRAPPAGLERRNMASSTSRWNVRGMARSSALMSHGRLALQPWPSESELRGCSAARNAKGSSWSAWRSIQRPGFGSTDISFFRPASSIQFPASWSFTPGEVLCCLGETVLSTQAAIIQSSSNIVRVNIAGTILLRSLQRAAML